MNPTQMIRCGVDWFWSLQWYPKLFDGNFEVNLFSISRDDDDDDDDDYLERFFDDILGGNGYTKLIETLKLL